jgi:trigger factor
LRFCLEERQASEPGDYLTGHAKMEDKGGKVHFESDGIVVQVPAKDKAPKGMIVGLMVEDLSTQIGLPKPGATVTVKTKGPDNHENEALRGVDLTVTYTPARCDRIIPASNADLVARFGLADEKTLTDGLRERLEGRVKMDQQAAMRSQIAKYLLEQTKMDLPQRLTAEQAGRNLERRRLELMYRGADAVQIEQNIAELRAASAFDAVRDLKLFFILDKAAEKMNVQVNEQEVNGRIAQMAFERGMRPDQLRQQMIQNGQATGIFNQIREHKVMDAIIGKAKVEEMSLEDYNKAISAENEEASKKSGKKA